MVTERRIRVSEGEIWGYEGGRVVFGITRWGNGYSAEDYTAGWDSPMLDIVGAWNLSQKAGVTKEEFEKAFGEIPKAMKVSIDEFVKWFFTAGQLPISIDAEREGTIFQLVVENIEGRLAEDLTDYAEERGLPVDSTVIRDTVYDFCMDNGLYDILDRSTDEEILTDVLVPVFGDFIRVEGDMVEVDIEGLMGFAETEGAFYGLYDVLNDFVHSKFRTAGLYEMYKDRKEGL